MRFKIPTHFLSVAARTRKGKEEFYKENDAQTSFITESNIYLCSRISRTDVKARSNRTHTGRRYIRGKQTRVRGGISILL
jgi:hypothetical protein